MPHVSQLAHPLVPLLRQLEQGRAGHYYLFRFEDVHFIDEPLDRINAAEPLFCRFGIDRTLVPALFQRYEDAGTLRRSAVARTGPYWGSTLALNNHINNIEIGSVTGLMDSAVIAYFMNLLRAASEKSLTFLEPTMAAYLPGGQLWTPSHTDATIDGVLGELNMEHLNRNVVLIPWHIRVRPKAGGGYDHWTLVIIDHRTRTVTYAEPLGQKYALRRIEDGNERDAHAPGVRTTIHRLLARARALQPDHAVWTGLAADAVYTVLAAPATLPFQIDGTSCGPFILLYAYFLVFFGRLPTAQDFAGDLNSDSDDRVGLAHTPLIMVVLDAIINGAVRIPLPASGSANAGAGSVSSSSRAKKARGDGGEAAGARPAVTLSNFALDHDNFCNGYRYGKLKSRRVTEGRRTDKK
jgi:hypothetical protein